jgi:hypothetical protein
VTLRARRPRGSFRPRPTRWEDRSGSASGFTPARRSSGTWATGRWCTWLPWATTVHVASRLEQLTKQYHCPLVISALVGRRSGLDLSALARHELAVRHRREPLATHAIDDVARLVAPLSGARRTSLARRTIARRSGP